MKLLVVSDSHGTMTYIRAAVEKERPDVIYHLGDHYSDAERLREEIFWIPIFGVTGNCDFGRKESSILQDEICGKRIFAVHGHQYGVKQDLMRLTLAAQEAQADICLFGHTHMRFYDEIGTMQIMNPGACGSHGTPSYGVIVFESGVTECSIRRFDEGRDRL